MALIDEVERRAELAAKVATLEERSLQNQKQLDRIESTLLKHANDEEDILRDINKSLIIFKEQVEEKISEAVTPIRDDLIRYKGIIGFVTASISVIFTVLVFVKEHLISWFSGR
jgi:hypothetical protein